MLIIGGTGKQPGRDNVLVGTDGGDIAFGDPHTGTNELGIQEIGGLLRAGQGGDDTIHGRLGVDQLYGDAWRIAGTGEGGNDRVGGGGGIDALFGDAAYLGGKGQGGDDQLLGQADRDAVFGDAYYLQQSARGGHDLLWGRAVRFWT
jgi:Ca2+-binding RTX toxin-like protein